MDKLTQPLFTVSVVSSLVGVSPQTLRNWEARGLVTPIREGRARRRLYRWHDIERLQRIHYLASRRRVPLRRVKFHLHLPQPALPGPSAEHEPRRGGLGALFVPPLAAALPVR